MYEVYFLPVYVYFYTKNAVPTDFYTLFITILYFSRIDGSSVLYILPLSWLSVSLLASVLSVHSAALAFLFLLPLIEILFGCPLDFPVAFFLQE
jgi:hypothetical protein